MADFGNPSGLRPKSTKIMERQFLRRSPPIGEAGLNVTRLGYCMKKSRSNLDGSYISSARCNKYSDLDPSPTNRRLNIVSKAFTPKPRVKINRVSDSSRNRSGRNRSDRKSVSTGQYGYSIFNSGL